MSLRVSLSRLTILAAVVLPACASQRLEGPPQDLHEVATPEPSPTVHPAPGPGPSAAPGRWRVWVPPQTTATGDIIEGHWVDLTLAPPRVDVVAPVVPMPRAPRPSSATPKLPGGTPALPAAGAPAQPAAPAAMLPPPVGVAPATATRVPTLRLPQALRNGLTPPAEETR